MRLTDSSIELLDGMVGMDLTNSSLFASSTEIASALDIGDLDHFASCMKQLIDEDLVRRRPPMSIREVMGYYVNMRAFEQLLRELDAGSNPDDELQETDWRVVSSKLKELETTVDDSELSQSDRAQAGAIIASLKILIEAPNPPASSIRSLLFDIAAISTVLAFAAQIAGQIF